jgi:hypothetical protein
LKAKEPKQPKEKKARASRGSRETKVSVQVSAEEQVAPLMSANGASGASLNGPIPTSAGNGASFELSEEMIRLRAYELFLARGGEHGRHLDDWLTAERELREKARAPH